MKKAITIAAAILVLASCGKDNNETSYPAPLYKMFSLRAGDELGQPLDGEISVIDAKGNYALPLTNGGGKTAIPIESGPEMIGLYPYDYNAFLASDGLALTIPDRQADCMNPMVDRLNLAAAVFDCSGSSADAVFRKIGAKVAFTLEDEDVTGVTFSSVDGSSSLAGSCFLTWNGDEPSLSFLNSKMSVSLQYAGQILEKDAVHYLLCAPAEMTNGAVVTLTYADGSVRMKRIDGPVSLKRGELLDLGPLNLGDIKKTPVFDEKQIVASLAMLSDTHIGNGYGSEAKFTEALRQLGSHAAIHDIDGLDGVVIVGDVTDANNANQAWSFKNLYEGVYSPADVPLVYTVGNHDLMNPLSPVLGDAYLNTDVGTKEMREQHECRHNVVAGVHILGLVPNHFGATTYDETVRKWLDDTLAELTEADPEKYVLVITHPMIYDTCYGSLLGTFWYTSQLTPILRKYPQAVAFGGHLHFPINDHRSIWQGEFTSMGCGSVSYMAIEDGKYEYMKSATVMKDAGDISSGLLLQFDVSGNMRITRMFFSRKATFGEPWEISYPVEDKSHLEKYNFEVRAAANTAPQLSSLEVNTAGSTATAVWVAGADDEFVHHYTLSLYKDGSLVKTKKILADFYRNSHPNGMKASWSEPFTDLSAGSYELRIIAEDSWGAVSNVLSKAFTL